MKGKKHRLNIKQINKQGSGAIINNYLSIGAYF